MAELASLKAGDVEFRAFVGAGAVPRAPPTVATSVDADPIYSPLAHPDQP
jgi:hypothetical protein